MSRKRKRIPQEPVSASIEKLSHEGRGIAHIDGKATFISGALPGEDVMFRYRTRRSRMDEGQCLEVLTPSPLRVEPKCQYFGTCGGCSLQHMNHGEQITHKQSVLIEQFEHIGKLIIPEVIPPIRGPEWGYRRKARLGVKYVIKKEKMLVGFREVSAKYLADIDQCEVLHPDVGYKIKVLQEFISRLSNYNQIPQIEVAVAENHTALILRHLEPFTEEDISVLEEFEKQTEFVLYLQAKGPDTVKRMSSGINNDLLAYQLPEFDLTMSFRPNDFTQINFDINQQMINQAIELLELKQSDRALDLFCGLGNFTLALARRCSHVIGVEGESELIRQANINARNNGISNVDFVVQDLAADDIQSVFLNSNFNKLLLDPARSGADVILQKMDLKNVERIVYVSCNPSTLARDAGILVHEKGFELIKAGIMDMFPHTAHVESMALFVNRNFRD